jgi:PAS domain S-box-containing protein
MAEEALRESENKFKDLAEKSFVGIYISQDKVFKYVNARFAEIHGYDIEEIIDKKTSEEMIFLEDLPPVEENVLARSSGAVKSLHYEFRIVAKTGEIKYVEVYGTDTIFQSKPATIGTILDITGRKQAEEALIKSEEKYRNIFENAVEGIFQTTPEGQFLRANPALARIFGFDSPGELIASTAGMIKALYANPEDRRTMIDLIETRGSAEGFETQFLRKDGERIWVSTNGWAVHDENGRTTYYEGTITDITNRKLAEEALQESEAKYRNVVDHLIVGFYVIQDNVFRFVNRRFCEISGYSYEELVDKINPLAIIHHDDRTIVAALLEKRMKGELDYIGSMFRGVKKDGQVIVVKGLSNMIIYDSRPAVAGTLIDITKETTLESQLRQAQKMEAVGTLAGGIAHDFNNILTVIIGYGRLLQMKMAEADPLRAYVAQMLSSAETAANLTRNLLTFSRKQIVELKSVKIGKIIKATERLLKSLLTEDIELKIISPDYDITIMADMSQIEQILLNLASNANDAMPRGGTLTIEAKEVELKNIFVDGYDYIESGKYARISVADTGTGIDEKTRNKIFEPFFTTKEVGKGTGLGLSIVHGIINQHHGYITVDSKPQGGTVFNVYFPAVKAPVEETETISPVAGGGTETILVAEDDAQVRGLTVEVLGSVGYTVIEAVDGEDAVKKFVEHSDTVGLLLLDVVMPRKNGKEAYDEIKKINPDIRVIFSSGYTGDVIIGKGIIGKEYDFIQKPLSPNELLLRIRETLDR